MAGIVQKIPDDLHQRLRVAVAQKGTTIRQFVEDAIREKVERWEAEEAKRRRGR